jgi:hypothetical protein
MMHEDWVEFIHIQSVSAFRIVIQIHFPGGIMGSDEREVNIVFRQGLLRDSGYVRVQMYSQGETYKIIEGAVEYCD